MGVPDALSSPSSTCAQGSPPPKTDPEASGAAVAAPEPRGMRSDCAASIPTRTWRPPRPRGPPAARRSLLAVLGGPGGPRARRGARTHLRRCGERPGSGAVCPSSLPAARRPRLGSPPPPPGPPPGRSTWPLHVALPAADAALARAESGAPAAGRAAARPVLPARSGPPGHPGPPRASRGLLPALPRARVCERVRERDRRLERQGQTDGEVVCEKFNCGNAVGATACRNPDVCDKIDNLCVCVCDCGHMRLCV